MCKNANCAGTGWADAIEILGPYCTKDLGDWDDAVSFYEIFYYNETTDPRVFMFCDGNYDVARGAGTFPVGRYDGTDLLKGHVDIPGQTGAVNSFIVPKGLTLTIYDSDF